MEKHLMTKTAGKQAAHTLSILTTVLNCLGGWNQSVNNTHDLIRCYTCENVHVVRQIDRKKTILSLSPGGSFFWSSINAAGCVFAVVFTEDSWHYLQAKERHKCRRELLIWISHIDLLNQNTHNFTWYLMPRGSWSLPLVA